MTPLSGDKLYADYRERVLAYLTHRTGRREDAEDLCADIFAEVFRSLPRYDPEKSSVSTWIYRITRSTLIDYLRTKRQSEPLSEDITAADDIDEDLIRRETLERLASALLTLGREERDIIILRYYKGYKLTDVSRLTGISYGMVKVKHGRALSALRARLEER